MSRNLGKTICDFCLGPVQLSEPARPITEDEAGRYFDEFRGLLVANAACTQCRTHYLAWVDDSNTEQVRQQRFQPRMRNHPFFDLSYRSTFDDEPDEADFELSPWVRAQLAAGWKAAHQLDRIKDILGEG